MKELLDYADEHADEILATLREMVELESFTADKGGVDTLSAYIRDQFEENHPSSPKSLIPSLSKDALLRGVRL
jgi:ferritin